MTTPVRPERKAVKVPLEDIRAEQLAAAAAQLVPFINRDPAFDPRVQLHVTEGVEWNPTRVLGQRYRPRAVIPAGPWLSLDEAAWIGIASRALQPLWPRCGVIRLPSTVVDALAASGRMPRRGAAIGSQSRELAQRVSAEVKAALVEAVENEIGPASGVEHHGGLWDYPGLDTLTVSDDNERIGIHLDTWEAKDYAGRYRSKTRVCINAGPGPRALLYVPFRLTDLAEALPPEKSTGQLRQADRICPKVFETYPRLPIMRLTLLPGQAYIADTDNMLHDGSSLMSDTFSLHYTMRAWFSGLEWQ